MTAYVVKNGDTLFKIAASFYGDGYQYGKILSANPQVTNPDLIRVGDIINVPGVNDGIVTNQLTTEEGEKASVSKQVILLAALAALGAGAFWYFNYGMSASANPEEDEEE